MSASEPNPRGEIMRRNVRKRREQPAPSSGVGKARGIIYMQEALVLLPPSAE